MILHKEIREKEFQTTCKNLNATLMFDCVGGSSTSKVFNLLPWGSTLVHYGNLELKRLNKFVTDDFIFIIKQLQVSG